MKIAIVGYGYVGKGMHRLFKDKVVAIYDPIVPEKLAYQSEVLINPDRNYTKECDLTIVSVFTAMDEDGKCDTSIVEEVIDWIQSPLILIKSTIQPGTTDKLIEKTGKRIVFSPEYLGEGKYFVPFWQYPDPLDPTSHGFMVLGGKQEDTEEVIGMMIRLMGPHTKFYQMAAKEAECVKYWENIWGAMKVIFSNHMYDCLKSLGVDYYKTREGWVADPRVERMHTAVFKDARGFSGKCYPKDLRAFIYSVEQSGFNPKLLKMIWNLNAEYRPEEFKKIE